MPHPAQDGHGPVRVGLVGLGGAAERILLPALARLDEVRIVGGSDIDPTARERVARAWRIPRTYADATALLTAERPEVAIVATPPLTHADLCLLALDHGCHVFCEKPFTASLAQADLVVNAARQKHLVVAVNNQYYQMPIYRRVKEQLDQGAFGRLYHIDVWQHMYLLPPGEGGWKAALQPHRVLYEFGTHALDVLCQFFGAYPSAVSARIPRISPTVDADLLVLMRLDFPEDRTANIVINRMSHAPKKYLEMRLHCERASVRISLGGIARAEVGWNSVARRPRLRFSLASGGEAWCERDGRMATLVRQSRDVFHGAAAAHFAQFAAATRNGGQPAVSAAHARDVLRIVFAGYQSAEGGGGLVRL